jgi:hypothetical protein
MEQIHISHDSVDHTIEDSLKPIHISFGCDCSIAYHLQKNNLRFEAYPFDWINSNIDGINLCISDNFLNFTNSHYLEFKNESLNFPLIDENWIENKTKIIKVQHIIYKFIFPHDFKDKNDKEINNFISKYSRRIERFQKVMKSNILKKLYIICKKNEINKLNLLNELLIKNNYQNFIIKFKIHDEFPKNDSWKRESFNWYDWFNE